MVSSALDYTSCPLSFMWLSLLLGNHFNPFRLIFCPKHFLPSSFFIQTSPLSFLFRENWGHLTQISSFLPKKSHLRSFSFLSLIKKCCLIRTTPPLPLSKFFLLSTGTNFSSAPRAFSINSLLSYFLLPPLCQSFSVCKCAWSFLHLLSPLSHVSFLPCHEQTCRHLVVLLPLSRSVQSAH